MHLHTTLEGCQDACRRGARCSGRLEELETIEKKDDEVCEECVEKLKEEEWVVVSVDGKVRGGGSRIVGAGSKR